MHNEWTTRSARQSPLAGVAIAAVVLGAWAFGAAWWASTPAAAWGAPSVVLALLTQTFLYTGLFITAHDAMHGTVAPAHPRLNHAIGALAVGLYALFPYSKLREAHQAHHLHPGEPGADPDFHDGEHSGFARWYLHFVRGYLRWWQVLAMSFVFDALWLGLGLDWQSLLIAWVIPSLLSTLQLFVVGTWLPHHDPPAHPTRARSLHLPVWASFLACYHFGYHRAHHEAPGVPWWRLPAAHRRLSSGA